MALRLYHGDALAEYGFGAGHPFGPDRLGAFWNECVARGLDQRAQLAAPVQASEAVLLRFHTHEYIERVKFQSKTGVGYLDGGDTPAFLGLYEAAATVVGTTLDAVAHCVSGQAPRAFIPIAGLHHARRDSAAGFCVLNDIGVAIETLRAVHGVQRIAYVDIDAHHGDGVEAAFLDDPEVFTLSLHMDTGYAYPFTGGRLEDAGTPASGHTSLNLPLPKDTHDAEYQLLFNAVWQPLLDAFQPDAVVLQAGTDMIFADPLGKLGLSTQCFLQTAQTILDTSPRHADGTPRLLVTGGGGYHPLVLARAWAGLWALLSGRELPEQLPLAGTDLLRSVGWDMDEDEAHFAQLFLSRLDQLEAHSVRPEIYNLIDQIPLHPYFRKP